MSCAACFLSEVDSLMGITFHTQQSLCGQHLPYSYRHKCVLSICDFTQRGVSPLAKKQPAQGAHLSQWSGTVSYNALLEGILYTGPFITSSISTFFPLFTQLFYFTLVWGFGKENTAFSQGLQFCTFCLPVKMKCLTPEVCFRSLIKQKR